MKLTKLILLGIGATALVLLPRRSSPKDTQKHQASQNQKENNATDDKPKNTSDKD